MDIALITLADHANVALGDKLNIIGTFDSISGSQFPLRHIQMVLVLILKASPAEYGRPFKLEVRLIDEDASSELMHIQGSGMVPRPRTPGTAVKLNHIFTLNNIEFPKPGTYEFAVHVDNVLIGTLPFYVVQTTTPPAIPQANAGPLN